MKLLTKLFPNLFPKVGMLYYPYADRVKVTWLVNWATGRPHLNLTHAKQFALRNNQLVETTKRATGWLYVFTESGTLRFDNRECTVIHSCPHGTLIYADFNTNVEFISELTMGTKRYGFLSDAVVVFDVNLHTVQKR